MVKTQNQITYKPERYEQSQRGRGIGDGRMDKQINKPTEQTESKTDSTAQGGTSGLRCKLVKLA